MKSVQQNIISLLSYQSFSLNNFDGKFTFFCLRFGLAIAIDNYLRLNIRLVYVGNFKFLLIEFVISNLNQIYYFETNV